MAALQRASWAGRPGSRAAIQRHASRQNGHHAQGGPQPGGHPAGRLTPVHQDTWRRAGLLARGVVGWCTAELSPHRPLPPPLSLQAAAMLGDHSLPPEQASAVALQMLSKPPAYPLGRGVLGGGGGGHRGAGSSGAGV